MLYYYRQGAKEIKSTLTGVQKDEIGKEERKKRKAVLLNG